MDKIYVLITVDTENPQFPLLDNKYNSDILLPEHNTQFDGIFTLFTLLEALDLKATFYLDIYEKELFGEKYEATLIDEIMKRGHDIQLHTHPVWLMDSVNRKKVYMWDYTYDEQIQILDYGIDTIKKMSGKTVIAHRGGSYGINDDTIKALKTVGISYDSSVFSMNCKTKKCFADNGVTGGNAIRCENGVTELSISKYYTFNQDNIWEKRMRKDDMAQRKVDINFTSLSKIKKIVSLFKMHQIHYLNLFMHSFSFYKCFYGWKAKYEKNLQQDLRLIVETYKILEYLKSNKSIEVVTVDQFDKILVQNRQLTKERDYIPILWRN